MASQSLHLSVYPKSLAGGSNVDPSATKSALERTLERTAGHGSQVQVVSGHKREGKNKLLNGKQSFRSIFFTCEQIWFCLDISLACSQKSLKVTGEKSVYLFIKAGVI